MPHDAPDHWHEPKAGENAGKGKFKRPPMPYDRFMEAEGIPVYRDIGVRTVLDLPLAPWKRLGGRGSYIQLYGTEGLWGQYVVEIPARGALNPERHLYEKVVFVVEGRGSTEVWRDGGKKQSFEWQKGSLFSIPLNFHHRLINASSMPALLYYDVTLRSEEVGGMSEDDLRAFVLKHGMSISRLSWRYKRGEGIAEYRMTLRAHNEATVQRLCAELRNLKEVIEYRVVPIGH